MIKLLLIFCFVATVSAHWGGNLSNITVTGNVTCHFKKLWCYRIQIVEPTMHFWEIFIGENRKRCIHHNTESYIVNGAFVPARYNRVFHPMLRVLHNCRRDRDFREELHYLEEDYKSTTEKIDIEHDLDVTELTIADLKLGLD